MLKSGVRQSLTVSQSQMVEVSIMQCDEQWASYSAAESTALKIYIWSIAIGTDTTAQGTTYFPRYL